MKKIFNYIITLILLIIFVLIFRFNTEVKDTIIGTCMLWFGSVVPFILPMYIITDLFINYSLSKLKINNYLVLLIISYLLGTPSNAKYIKEFYQKGLINLDSANYLLLFCYSPNPLFIIGIIPSKRDALFILLYLYLSNLIMAVLFYKAFNPKSFDSTHIEVKSFSNVISESISKTFNILILILGVMSIYSVLNLFIDKLIPNILFKSLLEITTGINYVLYNSSNYLPWLFLVVNFSGFSIHTQIKSILEDTPISYKYFLLGRLIPSFAPILFIIFS